jgi:carbamoyl-phosphate synthase large subunit
VVPIAAAFSALGFRLLATRGTADLLSASGLAVERVLKVHEGRPNVVDAMRNRQVDLVVNTPIGPASAIDDAYIRQTALRLGIPFVTALPAAEAAVAAIQALRERKLTVRSLQEWSAGVLAPS